MHCMAFRKVVDEGILVGARRRVTPGTPRSADALRIPQDRDDDDAIEYDEGKDPSTVSPSSLQSVEAFSEIFLELSAVECGDE